LAVSVSLWAAPPDTSAQRAQFSEAWNSASRGDRGRFEQLKGGLGDYVLYPYLQYEDLRNRRARVDDAEMSAFLDAHQDWAFDAPLRTAWLRTLGERGRWDSVITHAGDSPDTEVRCYLAHARIVRGQTEGVLREAQSLWAVGKSQPDACDPVFAWLIKQNGITPGLAWERFRLSMKARETRLARYLERFLSDPDRDWAGRWLQQDHRGYRRLDQGAAAWPDTERAREIAAYGLRRLARKDPDRAWSHFHPLDARFSWDEHVRAGVLREIALWSAVDGAEDTPQRMLAVPHEYRDDRLLEWWARHDLVQGDWQGVDKVVSAMSPQQKNDARWRYWQGRARLETGDEAGSRALLDPLAAETNYYGFLAADLLGSPYTICPSDPEVDPHRIDALASQPGFQRALELRRAGIANWARSEWTLAAGRLDTDSLRVAAALAVSEGWSEMAIFALGNSGDLRWYEWRFPLEYSAIVDTNARKLGLDPAWVMGLMRSESAMAVDAVSPAGARGLMQMMPGTARQIARRHALTYSGSDQLLRAEDNIRFGTIYLRELLDRFQDNPVLASGAYNAGPYAVDRWLKSLQTADPAIWVETLPYFETRDYIPRVLAFSAIYDWRLRQEVTRISERMPAFDSSTGGGTMHVDTNAQVVCLAAG
jgi:soluble lytic murein transglycosylase